MSKGLTNSDKRDLADRLLSYLVRTGRRSWSSTKLPIWDAAHEFGVPIYEIWHAYDLLRIMGRIGLVSPNGRSGFQLLDTTPLSMPGISVQRTVFDAGPVLVEILSGLYRRYPDEFVNALEEAMK